MPDAIIIGAGISGLYQLYRLRELGLDVQVFEAGTGVGGTWYWNRYPGARFDSESYSYGYSFSDEVLSEWEWSEHFSAQPETLRYVNYVADKFDLRPHIRFNARVRSAIFDESANEWEVRLEDGDCSRARLLITAIGALSAHTMPAIDGVEDFTGEAFHTARWPHHSVDFKNKRVAIIGTGATGVQTISEVAKTVGHLSVFQRTPNWCAPLHNRPITAAEQAEIKSSYADIFAKCRSSHGAFIHNADPRNALDLSPQERAAFFEQRYAEPGFGIWMGNFRDIYINEEANATLCEFVANKIRQRVHDPLLAEKLIPTNHGFGTRRVPLETNYYEVYNQPNVELIDINATPIERITARGISTSDRDREFDMIIYATGFDAVTGAFDCIDIRGVGGLSLRDKWRDGPQTFLGMQIHGFPNMLTLVGPHNAATFCNIPRCIEQNVEWVTDLVRYMVEQQLVRVDADSDAEQAWTDQVYQISEHMLFTKVDSWFMGINTNLAHKSKRNFLLYSGGLPAYRERCDEVAALGYKGMSFA